MADEIRQVVHLFRDALDGPQGHRAESFECVCGKSTWGEAKGWWRERLTVRVSRCSGCRGRRGPDPCARCLGGGITVAIMMQTDSDGVVPYADVRLLYCEAR